MICGWGTKDNDAKNGLKMGHMCRVQVTVMTDQIKNNHEPPITELL